MVTAGREVPGRWARKLGALRGQVARWGLARAAYSEIMDRLSPVLRMACVTVRPLGNLEPVESCAGCRIRVVSQDELTAAAVDAALDLDAAFIAEALARGDLCVGAFEGDRLVAYTWRSFSMAPHGDQLWVRFRKPYRYGYKAFTLPAYRGRHLQEAIGPLTDRLCRERGYTHGISFVETHNYPSLTLSARMEAVRVGYAGYICLAGRTLTFRSPGARRAGFGFSRSP